MFFEYFKPDRQSRVLDLGGLPGTWRGYGDFKVVLVNLLPHPTTDSRFVNIEGNVLRVPLEGRTFDIVFSNSVIEHLGNWENQQTFASEVKRMGSKYWIQTPARWFPIEPHLIAPFVHYLPRRLQRHLIRWFTVWGWINRPSPEKVQAFLDEVRLLTYSEMKTLFSDAKIIREQFLGLTKSYIALKN